jgi:hypothetical protein
LSPSGIIGGRGSPDWLWRSGEVIRQVALLLLEGKWSKARAREFNFLGGVSAQAWMWPVNFKVMAILYL